MTNSEIARLAEAAGMTFFIGSECRNCGGTWRYVRGSSCPCVTCTRKNCRKRQIKNRDRMLQLQKRWRKENSEYYRSWRMANRRFGAKPAISYGGDQPG